MPKPPELDHGIVTAFLAGIAFGLLIASALAIVVVPLLKVTF